MLLSHDDAGEWYDHHLERGCSVMVDESPTATDVPSA
jgi:hypothetical protein